MSLPEAAVARVPAGRLRLTAPWWGLALALAAGSAAVQVSLWTDLSALRDALDWQRALLGAQPWRWWSAAFPHLDTTHLAANLAGCAVVAAFGLAAGLGRGAALAWLLAWPLTHLTLALAPGVERYAGLSGVLHAGVATGAVFVIVDKRPGVMRWIGVAVAAGLLAKLVQEQAWVAPVQRLAGWDFPVVVAAHAAGALAGTGCALAVLGWRRCSRPTMPA
jgi:rhomboid family GlyGly-CTERM serine protease